MIVCAGKNESFKFATAIGIGLVESAVNLTRLITQNANINEIIFIGTAGLYRDGEILNIYESRAAVQHEISQICTLAYSPIFDQICEKVSYETLITNSSNYITTDENIANTFADLGYFMENMEFFSVMQTAKYFGIPARAILCATNFCNSSAHDDFIKNHAKAKEKLTKYLKDRGLI